MALAILSSWFTFFPELLYQWLIYTKQTAFLIITQISGALSIGVTLFILYYYSLLYGYNPCIALSIGTLLPTIIAGVYFYKLLKNIQTTLTVNTLTMYLKLGLPFLPTILANWCIISAQRFIIAQQCSLHDAGLYTIIDLMNQLCTFLLLQPIATIILPEIFERFSTTENLAHENKQAITTMWHVMAGLSFLGLLAYFPTHYCVTYILPPQYISVLPLTFIIFIGNIFLLGTYFLQCLAQYKKKTFFLSTSLSLSGGLSLFLSYLLISFFGLAGAAWATTVAYGIYFVMCYRYNLRLSYYCK
jgi:O-antigen/teichoic acid export membrane protein